MLGANSAKWKTGKAYGKRPEANASEDSQPNERLLSRRSGLPPPVFQTGRAHKARDHVLPPSARPANVPLARSTREDLVGGLAGASNKRLSMKASGSSPQQPRARPPPMQVATSATSSGKSSHDSHGHTFLQRSPSEESDEIQIIEPPPKRVKVAEPVAATNPIPPLAGPSRIDRNTTSAKASGNVKAIKQEPTGGPLDTRTIMAIKEEQRSPSPLEPQPRAATSGTIRFHPLPPSCTHADPNYKRNRSYWARDQWNAVLKRNPDLQKGHAMIRYASSRAFGIREAYTLLIGTTD